MKWTYEPGPRLRRADLRPQRPSARRPRRPASTRRRSPAVICPSRRARTRRRAKSAGSDRSPARTRRSPCRTGQIMQPEDEQPEREEDAVDGLDDLLEQSPSSTGHFCDDLLEVVKDVEHRREEVGDQRHARRSLSIGYRRTTSRQPPGRGRTRARVAGRRHSSSSRAISPAVAGRPSGSGRQAAEQHVLQARHVAVRERPPRPPAAGRPGAGRPGPPSVSGQVPCRYSIAERVRSRSAVPTA